MADPICLIKNTQNIKKDTLKSRVNNHHVLVSWLWVQQRTEFGNNSIKNSTLFFM